MAFRDMILRDATDEQRERLLAGARREQESGIQDQRLRGFGIGQFTASGPGREISGTIKPEDAGATQGLFLPRPPQPRGQGEQGGQPVGGGRPRQIQLPNAGAALAPNNPAEQMRINRLLNNPSQDTRGARRLLARYNNLDEVKDARDAQREQRAEAGHQRQLEIARVPVQGRENVARIQEGGLLQRLGITQDALDRRQAAGFAEADRADARELAGQLQLSDRATDNRIREIAKESTAAAALAVLKTDQRIRQDTERGLVPGSDQRAQLLNEQADILQQKQDFESAEVLRRMALEELFRLDAERRDAPDVGGQLRAAQGAERVPDMVDTARGLLQPEGQGEPPEDGGAQEQQPLGGENDVNGDGVVSPEEAEFNQLTEIIAAAKDPKDPFTRTPARIAEMEERVRLLREQIRGRVRGEEPNG